jgi:signal transduction histidine kinase
VLVAELFQNLVENAVKYRADRPPRVHVSAARVGVEVVFSVRDNGIGIAERDQATIFRPFTQLNHAGGGGLGLGLATCKRIVERHGGRIWVESAAGEGATFRFALPATPPGARKP